MASSSQPSPLAPLFGKLPRGWECWVGVGGILYARRLKSSPPIVVRAADPAQLRDAIARAISERCKR